MKYTLKEEHRKQLKPWADKWIKNAMSTRPIKENEKPIIREHVKGLYKSAGLTPPPDYRIVFVASPFIARFAAGFASWIWYCRNNKKAKVLSNATSGAIHKAIRKATSDATNEVTYKETSDSTRKATRKATREATRNVIAEEIYEVISDATCAATEDVAREATKEAIDKATYAAISVATDKATYEVIDKATRKAISSVTYEAIDDATSSAIREATHEAIDKAIDMAIDMATSAVTYDAIDKATYAAISAATDKATYEVIDKATRKAISAVTYNAIDKVTYEAIREAIRDATSSAIRDATYKATCDVTHDPTYKVTEEAIDKAIHKVINMATSEAISDATNDATYEETYEETYEAIDKATRVATNQAIDKATREATRAATHKVIDEAISDKVNNKYSKWYIFNEDVFSIAKKFGDPKILLQCSYKTYRMYQGGNFWSGWSAFISFFRYIAKLPIDYSKWDHYEKLSELSSWRIMHEKFCIISDRPEKLEFDDNKRPHCNNGPFCRWRDGSSLYAVHGVNVPAWIVEFPEKITVEKIQSEKNLEIQRVMIEFFGFDKYLLKIKSEVIDMDIRGISGGGARVLIKEENGNQWLICTDGSTERVYNLYVSNNVKTCKEAHEELCGFNENLIKMEG